MEALLIEIDSESPVRAYHEAGRIALRARKWLGIEERELVVRTGMRLKRAAGGDITYHFMRHAHLFDDSEFDTELMFWNECPTLVPLEAELVIKVLNETSAPIVVRPGECLGFVFAIKPISACEIVVVAN
jgi:hypothetical protein